MKAKKIKFLKRLKGRIWNLENFIKSGLFLSSKTLFNPIVFIKNI